MGYRVLSDQAFRQVIASTTKAGSTTFKGEERRKKNMGLDPFVDPSAHGIIRRSWCRFTESEDGSGKFIMVNGVAIAVESNLDGTGSMGAENIKLGLKHLKKGYDLFSNYSLKRYDPQIATSMFGDEEDQILFQRTQFEMDEKIADQMTRFDLEGFHGHANSKEDPQYALFGATYLTECDIWRYGLKNYHFTLSDEAIVDYLNPAHIVRVFGPDVWDKLKENGFSEIDRKNLPTTKEMVRTLLKRTHAFFFLFNPVYDHAGPSWIKNYGHERVVFVPRIEYFPLFEAAICALTEGVVSLVELKDFLEEAGVNRTDASIICDAVSEVPLRAQADLPGFDKIPAKGSVFAKKRDLWPIDESSSKVVKTKKNSPSTAKKQMWL